MKATSSENILAETQLILDACDLDESQYATAMKHSSAADSSGTVAAHDHAASVALSASHAHTMKSKAAKRKLGPNHPMVAHHAKRAAKLLQLHTRHQTHANKIR